MSGPPRLRSATFPRRRFGARARAQAQPIPRRSPQRPNSEAPPSSRVGASPDARGIPAPGGLGGVVAAASSSDGGCVWFLEGQYFVGLGSIQARLVQLDRTVGR